MFDKSAWKKKMKNMEKTDQIDDLLPSQDNSLESDISKNLEHLKTIYSDCADLVFRSFLIGGKTRASVIYIDGLANIEEIDDNILASLMQQNMDVPKEIKEIAEQFTFISKVSFLHSIQECIEHISFGSPVLLIDEQVLALSFGLQKHEKRSVEESQAEAVVRGPREAFTETIAVNTTLIRRKIRSPKLKMKVLQIGEYTNTPIIITYIDGLVDKTLIEEITNRLKRIEIDGILESGYIEEFIQDDPYSPFPQLLDTERPDVVAASLLEGRAAILVDGTPMALIAPVSLYSFLQASEDYYNRFIIGNAIRWLRYLFLVIALLLPSFYVAILTFHQEMIPTTLLITIATSREQVPFPALFEALIMEVVFEAIREAGLRLPKQIGAAVSIVGALVIGEAAVSAGLISSPIVMVVAITGIASFTIPRYSASTAIRMLRFPMIFMAGTLGLLGIMLGVIVIVIHLCTLRSFGIPYLQPLAPMKGQEMKDVLIRAPWFNLTKRPHFTGESNKYRQSAQQQPSPKKGSE